LEAAEPPVAGRLGLCLALRGKCPKGEGSRKFLRAAAAFRRANGADGVEIITVNSGDATK
jgi:hypothetical protein